MKRLVLGLAILIFSMDLLPVTLFSGNPMMLIRCRNNALQQAFGEPCDMPGFITYEGHCFPLAVDGECPEVPGFVYLVPMEVTIDDEAYTICVPDCSTACVETCDDGILYWDAEEQGCVCDDEVEPELCGCPSPLVENIYTGPLLNIIDGGGYCTLPEQDCYDLGIEYTIQPFICDGPEQGLDTIRITIKPAGGGTFNPFEDALTIEDLINCDLIDSTDNLEILEGIYGEDDRIAFVADAAGCIILEFTRDPTMDTEIRFLGGNNETIVVPACPRVFDPCSCRPENITDANNIVQYWYDEFTYTGTPSTAISVAANNTPDGFLDNSLTPYPTGVLGMTDAQGLLSIAFFRTPGFDTDVDLSEPNGQTANLSSGCTLAANACANIVPTLGQWSVIILGILLLIIGVVSFRARVSHQANT